MDARKRTQVSVAGFQCKVFARLIFKKSVLVYGTDFAAGQQEGHSGSKKFCVSE